VSSFVTQTSAPEGSPNFGPTHVGVAERDAPAP
jgi:hypothetical protein